MGETPLFWRSSLLSAVLCRNFGCVSSCQLWFSLQKICQHIKAFPYHYSDISTSVLDLKICCSQFCSGKEGSSFRILHVGIQFSYLQFQKKPFLIRRMLGHLTKHQLRHTHEAACTTLAHICSTPVAHFLCYRDSQRMTPAFLLDTSLKT